MASFEFTVVASGLDPAAKDFFDRFYAAGCDDATVAFQNGRIVADLRAKRPRSPKRSLQA